LAFEIPARGLGDGDVSCDYEDFREWIDAQESAPLCPYRISKMNPETPAG